MDGPDGDSRPVTPPLVLCDPPREPFWPLAATRPVAELLAGTRTFRARWAARAGPVQGLWCDREVHGCAFRTGDPGSSGPPLLNVWPEAGSDCRVALATWLPPAGWEFGDEPVEFRAAGAPVAWRLNGRDVPELSASESPGEVRSLLAALGLPVREVGGLFLDSIWSVVAGNPDLIAADAAEFPAGETVTGVDPVVLLGETPRVGADVSIGPFAVLDARQGPIVLDRGASIEPFTLLKGPLYVGPDSAVLGGTAGPGTSIGPSCKVRGEVEGSIFQGYDNKAHDGFVGHSVLGEWVNLGAGTITSDLKNTYGPVRVSGPAGRATTGLLKVGAFLGDHVKTGIGSLLTTGARLGVGTHFFGGRAVSPAWLPDFTWHDGEGGSRAVRLDAFLRASRAAMTRRGQALGGGEQAMLEALHRRASGVPARAS